MKLSKLRLPVILFPGGIFIATIILGYIDSEGFISTLTGVFETMMYNLGWLVSLAMLLFIAFVIIVIFHPIGKIKLGGPNAKPKMSYWQWFGISLTTGIGAGVVFWGAVEPLLFAMEPAPSLGLEAGSNEAIIWSMRTTFLHWTITPYASCVAIGLVLAYVIHNMRMPYKVSSGLVPVFGKKFVKSKWATVVDVITVFGLIGGVAGGLGYGIMQLSESVHLIFGIEPGTLVFFAVAGCLFLSYMATGISGLKKGILWLGDKNTQFYFVLLAFLLLIGPTAYIFNLATQSLGSFVGNFLESITFTAPFADSELWPQWWDQYWWVDWLAFGPMLGLFFVRLGYGRSIREFVVVNWLFPALFGFVWFSIFGGNVLFGQFFEGTDYYDLYLSNGAEAMTFSVLNDVPLSFIMKIFMLIIIAISLITQCNSMIGTISSMTLKDSSETEEAPTSLKFFWGIIIIAVALVFTLTGGIEGIKMVKTFAGFPIVFFALLVVIGFIRYMLKRPRDSSNKYIYENEVVNAPNSDEPEAEPSKFSLKLQALINKRNNNH
ncbi:MAG: BCCT family transporter [Lachnospiraceae bacterium]